MRTEQLDKSLENIEYFLVQEKESYLNWLKRVKKDCNHKYKKKYEEFLGKVIETEEEIYMDVETVTIKGYLSNVGTGISYNLMLLEQFEMAKNENDWESVRRSLYQRTRCNLIPKIDVSEEDHCYYFQEILDCFGCGDFSSIETLFPKELGESTNGYIFRKIGTNLIMGMYYHDTMLENIALRQAEKYIDGKDTKWMRAVIGFLAAVMKRDFPLASEQLFVLCKSIKRAMLVTDEYKSFCTYAHGLYQFAGEYLSEEEFAQIKMPEIDNFSKEYVQYCLENKNKRIQPYIIFPKEMELVNKVFLLPLPKTEVVYMDGGNTRRCVDFEKMINKFVLELKNA